MGFVSSLISMIRAILNGGNPAAHAAAHPAGLFPPEPTSSTKITKGLPLIFTGIVICAVAPSFQYTSPTTFACGFGTRA